MKCGIQLCALCANESTKWCICIDPPLPLCDGCSVTHQLQRPGLHRVIRQWIDFGICREDAHAEVMKRLASLDTFQTCVDLSLLEVRECLDHIEQFYSDAVKMLTRQRAVAIASVEVAISAFQREVAAARNESLNHITELDYSPSLPLAAFMWSCPEPCSLFHWERQSTPDLSALYAVKFALNVTAVRPRGTNQIDHPPSAESEASKPSYGVDLGMVYMGALRFFSTGRQRFTRPIQVTGLNRSLKWPHLVAVGGQRYCAIGESYYGRASSEVWVIEPERPGVRLDSMMAARQCPGVVWTLGHLYVFGGAGDCGRVLDSAESLALSDPLLCSHWQSLPSMTSPRRCFTPCSYLDYIYICGGQVTTSIELFDCILQQYTQLGIRLPEASESLTVLLSSSELLTVTKRYFVTISLDGSVGMKVKSHYEWCGIAGGSGGVVVGRMVYSAAMGEVNEFDLESGKLTRFRIEQ